MMIKRATILALFILGHNLLFCQSEASQTELMRKNKHIVAISYSLLPITSTDNLFTPHLNSAYRDSVSPRYGIVFGEFGVEGIFFRYTGSSIFSAVYGQHLTKKLTLMLNFSYQSFSRDWHLYVDANSPHYFTEHFYRVQMMPELQFDYIRTERAIISSSFGMGVNYLWNNTGGFDDIVVSRKGANLVYQIWFVGVNASFTDHFGIRFGLGYGTRGVVELGFAYRF